MDSFRNIPSYYITLVISFIASVLILVPVLLGSYTLLALVLLIAVFITYILINNFHINIRELLIIIIALSITLPGIKVSSSFPLIRPEEFLIYTLFPFIFIYNISTNYLNDISKIFTKYYIIFLFLAIISTIYGVFFLNVNTGLRDAVEFVKMGKYLLIFLTVCSSKPTEKDLNILLNTFVIVLITASIIGILQFFNIFGFSSITGPFYLGEKSYIVNQRLTGTFTNPNSFSVVLGFGIIISLVKILYEKNYNYRLYYILCIGLFIVCILITGSRTGLAAIIFAIATLLILFLRFNIQNLKSVLPVIVILILSFIFGVVYAGQDIINRLSSGINLLENESLLMRFYAWYLNFQLIIQSPIFGWGPAKEILTTVVDNEYILVVRRYGILGASAFVLIYFYPFYIATKNYFRFNGDPYALIFVVTLLFFMISNLTNSVYNHIQTMDMWFIILGAYFGLSTSGFKSNTVNLKD